MAGGVDIAKDLSPTPTVLPEWVLRENPKVAIFLSTDDYSPPMLKNYFMTSAENASAFLDEAATRQGLNGTDAVKERQLYVMDQFLMATASRDFISSLYVAKWLYPEKFQDIDPDSIHSEYFEKWLGIPYTGTWTYSQAS